MAVPAHTTGCPACGDTSTCSEPHPPLAAAPGRSLPSPPSEDPTPERAHFGGLREGTAAVGAHPAGASPYGILDLAGNVWEWCEDVNDEAFYADGPSHNPCLRRATGRPTYVMRGGSFGYDARSLRTTARMAFEPHYRFSSGGFRCAKSAR